MYTREIGGYTGVKKYDLPQNTNIDNVKSEETIDFADPKDEFIHEEEPSFKPPKNVKILVQNEKFTISSRSTVTFNGAMRNAQINSAKNKVRIGNVMSNLNTDLRQVRAGVRTGACDISELRKVESAIRRAKYQKNKISK